jgi:hypothetical protein
MLLSISTSLNRSTIDFLQSGSSEFFAARPSRIVVTSTDWAGTAAVSGVAAGAATAGATAEAVGVVPEGAVAASIVVVEGAGVAEDGALSRPKIFDIKLLNTPISFNGSLLYPGCLEAF